MVLLYNVFITGTTPNNWSAINVNYDRGNLNNPNKVDIVKYALSSTAKAYPWKRAIINVELDSNYPSPITKEELEEFIRREFEGVDLYFSHMRNKFQEDWVKTYDLINDDFIYYQGNHDHIFFNASNDYLKSLIDIIKEDTTNKYKTLVTSHWCEFIRSAKCGYIYPYWVGSEPQHNQFHPTEFHKNYIEEQNYISFDNKYFDSYNIITKNLYKNWFLEGDWEAAPIRKDIFPSNKIEIPRTEGVGIIGLGGLKEMLNLPVPTQKVYVPYEEIFRHFDGHFHQKISNNICPAIDIPIGYFEKEMKIRYGYDDYKEGWTNINPKNPNYYAYDKTGTDYKFTLNDLPYIWKDRIVEIDTNPDISEEEMLQYRLKSILETIYNDSRYNPHINKSIEDSVIKQYLKRFPNFSL